MWTYATVDRLDDLIVRSREAERYLLRERCDRPSRTARAALDARLAVVQGRLGRLRAAARAARRAARAEAEARHAASCC